MFFLKGIAFTLVLNILMVMPGISNSGSLPVSTTEIIETESSGSISMPEWVTRTPDHCFVGISNPCQTIEEARQQALNSAISQVLQAMGAEYSLKHTSTLAGISYYAHHRLDEQLTYTSRWFIRSIQQNIIKSKVYQIRDRFTLFVLINFPPEKIERLRKLTLGPKVTAEIIKKSSDRLAIQVRENNGVQVTFTKYQMEINKTNRHAGIITLFAWKVPEFSSRNYEGVIEQKICLKGDTQIFNIPHPTLVSNFKHLILGTETQMKIFLKGYDEISRQLSVTVQDPF
jgi:hypothetical protein